MGKRRTRKNKKSVQERKDQPANAPRPENPSDDENPFDFGGLPARDLKKNLGCG
jgi:hypothetical protein